MKVSHVRLCSFSQENCRCHLLGVSVGYGDFWIDIFILTLVGAIDPWDQSWFESYNFFSFSVSSQQTLVLMKTSWRRLDQDEYIRLTHTSSRRLHQDQHIRLGHTSSRRLQDVFKTSSDVSKTSLRRLQDVFRTSSRHLQDVFKMFWKRLQDVFKTSSRHFQDVLLS